MMSIKTLTVSGLVIIPLITSRTTEGIEGSTSSLRITSEIMESPTLDIAEAFLVIWAQSESGTGDGQVLC